jgi:hypothetical protein
MDPLFDRLDMFNAQGLLTDDELEMLKASVVELALIDLTEINLAEEPDFVASDGRSLTEHARDACHEAGVDLDADESDDEDDVQIAKED